MKNFPFDEYIAAVPDFPKPGILFRDITPLLASPKALKSCLDVLKEKAEQRQATHVVGIESRGFIFGVPLAQMLNLPFIPARKPGKLPREVRQVSYALEYGHDSLSIHKNDLPKDARVLIVDDLLATGGTAAACGQLVTELGAEVASYLFVIELLALEGHKRLVHGPHDSLLTY